MSREKYVKIENLVKNQYFYGICLFQEVIAFSTQRELRKGRFFVGKQQWRWFYAIWAIYKGVVNIYTNYYSVNAIMVEMNPRNLLNCHAKLEASNRLR